MLSRFAGFGETTGVVLVAMITTGRASQWPLDVAIGDLDAAGLRHTCVVRMKLATLDLRRIDRKVGRLAEADRNALAVSLAQLLPLTGESP